MAEYLGSSAVVHWLYGAGTTVLSADFRTFSFTPTTDKIDATAGSDSSKVFLSGMTDYTCKYTGVAQAGGTALRAALACGNSGTLKFWPEGSSANHPLYTFPCTTTTDSQSSWAYNQVSEVSVEWMANGAYTIT